MARLARKKASTEKVKSVGRLNICLGSINMLSGEVSIQKTSADIIKISEKMLFLEKKQVHYVPGKVAKTLIDTLSRRTELLGDSVSLSYRCISKGDAEAIVKDAIRSYLATIIPRLSKIKI